VPRIGWLAGGVSHANVEAFRHGLREHGYVEGQTIAIEYRFAADQMDRLPALAAELVDLPVDIIVAGGGVAAGIAAKNATSTIPIVTAAGGDPVEGGLVASLARPGGNVTGVSGISHHLSAKRLELLRDAVPSISRIAVLWNAGFEGEAREWRETQVAAEALGVEAQSLEVRGANDLESAFEAATRERPNGLIVLHDGLTFTHRARIVEFAAKGRLPAMYEFREWTEAGGLMNYAPSRTDMARRAAYYVDRILKGAKPADLPIEQPMRFDFVINLRTAQALGLTLPQSILVQATELIQ
jgi:putative ABC transport system substrate-binding protein